MPQVVLALALVSRLLAMFQPVILSVSPLSLVVRMATVAVPPLTESNVMK